MTNNDLFYVCSLIEYIARKTDNRRSDVVSDIGINGIEKLLKDAPVNHCLSFEQVCDEICDEYNIEKGSFDTITKCKYTVPGYMDIGKLYAIIIEEIFSDKKICEGIYDVFTSFLSEEISDFSTDLYYQNPDYLVCSYREGHLL